MKEDVETTTEGPWVEHTGDGTLVHNTDRDDTQLKQALKEAGFRWGRSITAWFLPRAWRYPTRTFKVRRLVALLEAEDRTIRVEVDRERKRSSAEIHADKIERAEANAERYADRATTAQATSDALWEDGRKLADARPLGQPILVGHHSEAGDRRYLARIDAKYGRSIAEQERADYWEGRAASAEHTANGDTPGVIARRIERLEADRRRVARYVDGTQSPWDGPASGRRLERLQADADDLDEQIEFNKQLLTEAEKNWGGLWTPGNIKKGDEVLVLGSWYPVLRVNKKTVTVTPLMDHGADRGRSWTDTVPYHQLKGRRRDGVAVRTPDGVA